MHRDSSPVTARRSAETRPRRAACQNPAQQPAVATAERPQPVNAAARRSRLDDAIVSQWLLDQVPSEHRHVLGSAANRQELAA
jgi:hypothetical protein